jgi:Ser/Thr protein kinase RdoA (MazF antagonist)
MGPSSIDPGDLQQVAEAFRLPGAIKRISPLGSGNVNATFLVETAGGRAVLQRINTVVFPRPELVMGNLEVLSTHVKQRLQREQERPDGGLLGERRWVLPELIRTHAHDRSWALCSAGGCWRMLAFVEDSRSLDVVSERGQAHELGWGLGLFHRLIGDLPPEHLADTLEGFHITPRYLDAYHQALVRTTVDSTPQAQGCVEFIRERTALVSVLENAKARGDLPLRPIHGDPKINNLLIDPQCGAAIALVDLDTVKPGLVHYDIGDGLRSCCNRLGEETTDFEQVHFDLDLAEAMLEGYLAMTQGMLSPLERQLIPEAARLISFELGLRFFTDHLNGNIYFRANHRDHNLHRALVQFRLTASIEAQIAELQALVERLTSATNSPQGNS